MRIALVSIFSVIVAGMIPCHANLGDTLDRCIARYGKRMSATGVSDPSRIGGEEAVFQKNGVQFQVYLFKDIVECETITKIDSSPFSEEERKKVVQMESTEGSWAKPISTHGQLSWARSDGALIFCYPVNTSMILAVSKNYIQLAEESKKTSPKFPSEDEVKKDIVPGMSEADAIKKIGVPNIRSPEDDGELWIYLLRPVPYQEMNYGYGGFEIVIKDGKVADMHIIHQTVRASK